MKKLYFGLLVILISCTHNNAPYTGHYHYIEDDNYYHTVTITDSSVFVNEYTIGGEFLFKNDVDTVYIPPIGLIKNTDNKVIGVFDPDKWIKVEHTPEDFKKDISSNLFIEYIPPTDNKISYDAGIELTTPIFIGKPKPEFKEKFTTGDFLTKDGYYVQYLDMILEKTEIADMLHGVLFPELTIHADKDAPRELIEEVVSGWLMFNFDNPVYLAKMNLQDIKLVRSKF